MLAIICRYVWKQNIIRIAELRYRDHIASNHHIGKHQSSTSSSHTHIYNVQRRHNKIFAYIWAVLYSPKHKLANTHHKRCILNHTMRWKGGMVWNGGFMWLSIDRNPLCSLRFNISYIEAFPNGMPTPLAEHKRFRHKKVASTLFITLCVCMCGIPSSLHRNHTYGMTI